jgi:hypothetical protein
MRLDLDSLRDIQVASLRDVTAKTKRRARQLVREHGSIWMTPQIDEDVYLFFAQRAALRFKAQGALTYVEVLRRGGGGDPEHFGTLAGRAGDGTGDGGWYAGRGDGSGVF